MLPSWGGGALTPAKGLKIAVAALFFLSGLSGLVYEVLWTRSLTLVFGNTVVATSTVLAAFMGGLALGAWAIGRFADRCSRPLLLYAGLEALVGASALAFPFVLATILPLLKILYRSEHTLTLGWVRFLVAFAFLLLPTAAMGGTLPVLARLLARVEDAGRTLAFLYGINTLGATIGTVAAGFFLLPAWGLGGTLASAVTMNVAVALAAGTLSLKRITGQEGRPPNRLTETPPPESVREARDSTRYRVVLAAFLLSGAIALALEVLWTRSLLLVFGSTVYSFSIMLAVFLLGLALGSTTLGAFVERIPRPALTLGIVEGGIALLTLASVGRINALPSAFLNGLIAHGFTWHVYLGMKALIAAGVLLPVALLFGATFPLVARIEVFQGRRIGGQVGLMYAFNTVGAIAGSLLAGFVLLPALGLQRSLTAVALTALALGLVLLLAGEKGQKPLFSYAAAALLALVGITLAVTLPPWSTKILSAGVYFRPTTYLSPDGKRNDMSQVLGNLRVLDYVEGVTETAAVVQTPISRMFIVDGKVEAATDFVDMRLQRLQGQLPMLFAPRYDKALNIGLGCGITLGSLSAYPLKALECVELEPKIVATARYFAEQNEDVLDDPRLQVIINDGRNHLLLTDQKYDVITSDPFEPLVAGAASLYTENHFRIAKERLTPGGVMGQYLPLYQLFPSDYQMIIRSFCRVFPHVALWYTGIDSILLGSDKPLTISYKTLQERMDLPEVRQSLAGVGVSSPVQLLQTFVMDPSHLPAISGPGRLNTDEHPYIEFSAPRSHLVNTTLLNLKWLLANYRPQDLPLAQTTPAGEKAAEKARGLGKMVMEATLYRFEGKYADALVILRRAQAHDPGNRDVLFETCASANLEASGLMAAGRLTDAKSLLDEAFTTGEQKLNTLSNLATWAFRSGDFKQALDYTKEALALNPAVPDTNLKMALCLENLGQPAQALPWCEKALVLNPQFIQAQLTRADLALAMGDKVYALKRYLQVLHAHPHHVSGQDWLVAGTLLAESSRWSEARDAFESAARLSPQDPRAWYNLARVQKVRGDGSAARKALDRALGLAPAQVKAWLAHDPIFGGAQTGAANTAPPPHK